jgi:lysophospholipase L1-like esterase
MKIIIFGDSMVYGAWDPEKGGWAQRIRNFLDKESLSKPENCYEIYNLGVPGNTTKKLLKRFEFETKQRIGEDNQELIFIFSIGVNDSQFIHSKNSLRFSTEEYKKNLNKLLNLAQKLSQKIIFLGLTSVDEAKTDPIPWNTDKTYKNEYIQKFNKVLRGFCQENKVYFIEIFEKLIKENYQSILEDGLHPNSKGHKKIFEIVKNYLIKNKII